MNVTEFAEQIVFGTTLEDKLIAPPASMGLETTGGSDVRSLVSPGRPVGLEMRHDLVNTGAPPSDDQLESQRARGQLLHYLANHELLATELMALVLLKFPEAPHAFRRGVLVTLQEEQEHTRMYIQRMRECGVEFGSYPLGGRFWRIVEPMQSPMDFVARLSLTFEQANLDYSLHFAKVFQRQGDHETAALLNQIYEDEIGHVRHGLHWFRQWKDPEHSDWQAYQELLAYPMSPQRGRGPRAAFNRKGRLRAGLTNDFIDAIEVFRQSTARPPTVRWFDPGAESELAGAQERDLLDQLTQDLQLVMVPVARQDDIVLVREIPSRELRKHLIDVGLDLPELVTFQSCHVLAKRKLRECAPWAWTPRNQQVAETLADAVQIPSPQWNDHWSELFRKSFGAHCLARWLNASAGTARDGSGPDWFCEPDCFSIEVNSEADVKDALEETKARGFERAIFKCDFASSGRGQRRLETGRSLDETDRAWLRSVFSQPPRSQAARSWEVHSGPTAVVEPELQRLVDFSFLWDVGFARRGPQQSEHAPGSLPAVDRNVHRLRFLGWTRSLVTGGRKYLGTRLTRPLHDCAPEVRQFLLAGGAERLRTTAEWLELHLTEVLEKRNFSGSFGVDAFLYRGREGELRVKPIVEFNARMTMGHVALAMQKKVAAGITAEFRVLTKPQWNQLPDAIKASPLETAKDGRWSSGLIRLSDIDEKTKLVPVVMIGREPLAAIT